MYLIVDFSDLDLEYTRTDIRFDEYTADYTVSRLIKELCNGIESFSGESVSQQGTLCLLGPNRKILDSTRMVSYLCEHELNDWDIIYLSRRR